MPLLGVAGAFLLWGQERAERDRKDRQRRQLLLLDYADVVYQMMVYIGAGLTVEKAWEQMVEDYERERVRSPGRTRPAYEEMAVTLNQIRNGEPEGRAISEFGRRCHLQPYRKLSSLLEQNRRTGSKNLRQLLEHPLLAFLRESREERLLCVFNAGDTEQLFPLDEGRPRLVLGQAGFLRSEDDDSYLLLLPPRSGSVFFME